MITYSVRLFLFSLMVVPLYSMDQPDPAIKNILLYEKGNVACLNNGSVLVNSLTTHESIIWNFKTGKTTDLCVPDHTLSMVHDPSKTQVLLLSCNKKPGVFNATIYDSQTNQKYPWECKLFCTKIDFGPSRNFLINVESPSATLHVIKKETFLYDYRTNSCEKEELKTLFFDEYPNFYPKVYISSTKATCRACFTEVFPSLELYLCDFNDKSVRKLPGLKGEIYTHFCCSSDASYMAYICDFYCCLMNLEKNILCVLEDKEGKFFCRALCMHPNNKHIVTMARDMSIHYWDITTRLCIAQQQSPIPIEEISTKQDDNAFYNVLSLSANGKFLAVAFPTQCVVYHVPCDVLYGVGYKEKFVYVLFLLKNYCHNDGPLFKEIVGLLMKKYMRVSKL